MGCISSAINTVLATSKYAIKIIFCITYDRNHPSNNIRQRSNPNNTHNKRQRKPLLKPGLLTVGYGKVEHQVYRPRQHPRNLKSLAPINSTKPFEQTEYLGELAPAIRPLPQRVRCLALRGRRKSDVFVVVHDFGDGQLGGAVQMRGGWDNVGIRWERRRLQA